MIAATILKKVGNALVDNLSERYKHHLEEKLENYKNTLENRSYVNKAKFDRIFNAYFEISKKLTVCFSSIKSITPKENQGISNPIDDSEIEENIKDLREFCQNHVLAFSRELLDEIEKLILIFEDQLAAYKNLSSIIDEEDYDLLPLDKIEELENNMDELLRKSYSNLEVSGTN